MMTSAIAIASPAATMIVCFFRPDSSRRRYVQYMGLLSAGAGTPAVVTTLGTPIDARALGKLWKPYVRRQPHPALAAFTGDA